MAERTSRSDGPKGERQDGASLPAAKWPFGGRLFIWWRRRVENGERRRRDPFDCEGRMPKRTSRSDGPKVERGALMQCVEAHCMRRARRRPKGRLDRGPGWRESSRRLLKPPPQNRSCTPTPKAPLRRPARNARQGAAGRRAHSYAARRWPQRSCQATAPR